MTQFTARALIATCLAILIPTATHAGPQSTIVVYTTSSIALKNVPPGTRVVYMDRKRHIEAELSKGLPQNPHQAALTMKQRMATPEFARLLEELRLAATDIAHARSLQIQKLPAVSVDDTYVIYGQPDVAAALKQIDRSRAQP